MSVLCCACGNVRVTNPDELCAGCRNRAANPSPDDAEHAADVTNVPAMRTILNQRRRILADLDRRLQYDMLRTKKNSDGRSTGRLENKGINPAHLEQAAKINRMTVDLTDAERKWVEAVDKASSEQSSDQRAEVCIVYLLSNDCPPDKRREAIQRLSESL